MKSRLLGDQGGRTYILVMDKGDEAVECLTTFAQENGLQAAAFTAIGAFEQATIAYFDRNSMSYAEMAIDDQVEVLSLAGNLTVADDKAKLHAHVVLGARDGSTRGGHLVRGVVWPTLEAQLTDAPERIERRTDTETGLPLIDLDRPG